MKARELIVYLQEFDPDLNLWETNDVKSFIPQSDLPMMGLRNELRYQIQELRKELELSVTETTSFFIEMITESNWFTSFCSPNISYVDFRDKSEPKTNNIEYLKKHCLLNSLVVSLSGLYFNGSYSVHDKDLVKPYGELLKTFNVDFNYSNFKEDILVKIYNFDK